MPTSTNNPIGNYTVGQAPGNNQINLGAMQGNLMNLLQSGNLGNNTPNPLTDIIANKGQSQLGFQNAMANARMANAGLSSQEQALKEAEQAYQNQQQQPGLTDFIGTGLSGANAVMGAVQKQKMMDLLKNGDGNVDYQAFLDSLNSLPDNLEG